MKRRWLTLALCSWAAAQMALFGELCTTSHAGGISAVLRGSSFQIATHLRVVPDSRLRPTEAATVIVGSLASLAADGRHSTGQNVADVMNMMHDGLLLDGGHLAMADLSDSADAAALAAAADAVNDEALIDTGAAWVPDCQQMYSPWPENWKSGQAASNVSQGRAPGEVAEHRGLYGCPEFYYGCDRYGCDWGYAPVVSSSGHGSTNESLPADDVTTGVVQDEHGDHSGYWDCDDMAGECSASDARAYVRHPAHGVDWSNRLVVAPVGACADWVVAACDAMIDGLAADDVDLLQDDEITDQDSFADDEPSSVAGSAEHSSAGRPASVNPLRSTAPSGSPVREPTSGATGVYIGL